jgi:hypothetical protein
MYPFWLKILPLCLYLTWRPKESNPSSVLGVFDNSTNPDPETNTSWDQSETLKVLFTHMSSGEYQFF